jgi:hypothetical protein
MSPSSKHPDSDGVKLRVTPPGYSGASAGKLRMKVVPSGLLSTEMSPPQRPMIV